ncbi:MAG: PfkB family carbohydrate kinase [Proteobacteria bacterium]|nr:PfkB family carbohydrate kinase [Pseudomonadota bacterium]MDA0992273.1 PfkB family carbohydrate kinase [Pseudomonadota bacterium]
MRVVCVGDCGIDHYVPSNERRCGGITANFARHARREFPADDRIEIVSCVGSDDGAALVKASLANSGISCHISELPGTTPVQTIEIDSSGEKNFVRYDEGVLRDFTFGANEREMIASCDLLVAPVYLQIVDLFDDLMMVQRAGLTAVDFSDFLQHPDFALLERHLDCIDIGFFGLSVGDADAIDRLADLAASNKKLFIVTLGADGSRAFHGASRFECLATPVEKVVDTTGAGDAFAAAFLASYCHGAGVRDAMKRGATLAAEVVGYCGSYVLPTSAMTSTIKMRR